MANPPTFADRSKARGPGLEASELRKVAAEANRFSAGLIKRLYDNWHNEPQVGCYSINVPLCETVAKPQVVWTRIWENRYGPLFAAETTANYPAPPAPQPATAPTPQNLLHFAPNMASLLGPKQLPEGTDVWAILNGYISVTRLRPNFMEVDHKAVDSACLLATAAIWHLTRRSQAARAMRPRSRHKTSRTDSKWECAGAYKVPTCLEDRQSANGKIALLWKHQGLPGPECDEWICLCVSLAPACRCGLFAGMSMSYPM